MLPLLLLALGLLAGAVRTHQVEQGNRERVERELDDLAGRVTAWTAQTLQRYEYAVRGTRGAIVVAVGDGDITPEIFHEYALSRDLPREFPGARGIGFVRRVPQEQLGHYLEQMELRRPSFRLQSLSPPAGELDVIELVEPLAGNAGSLGLDIATEPHRRTAAEAAMRSGQAVITAPITLLSALDHPGGAFMLLLPVYRPGAPTGTEAERVAATLGWTYTPLVIDEILAQAQWLDSSFALRLADITDPDAPTEFYGDTGGPPAVAGQPHGGRTLEQFGRTWRVEVQALPPLIRDLHLPSPAVEGAAVALAAFLLALVLYLALDQHRRRFRERLAQAGLAAIVESADSAIIGQALDGTVTSWNSAAERLFGYRQSEVLGCLVSELLPLGVEPAGAEMVATDSITRRATTRRHRDGRLLQVQVIESPIRGKHGEVIGLSSTIRDISHELAVERELLELNLKLEAQVEDRTRDVRRVSALQKAILLNAGHSVIAADLRGRISVFNPAAEALLGYTAAEMLGRDGTTLFDPVELAQHAQALSEELGQPVAAGLDCLVARLRRGQQEQAEWTFTRKDGRRLPVLLHISALTDAAGEMAGYIGMAIDLSERKHLEQVLGAERDRFRTIFSVVPGAIFTVNRQGIIEAANDRAETMFGYTPEQLQGRPISLLVPIELRAEHAQMHERYFGGNDHVRLMGGRVVDALHRDGHRVPVEVRLNHYLDADGPKVIAMVTDRSEQQMLSESEARWRTMASTLPQLVWTCTAQGDCDFLSRQWTDYTGIPADLQLGAGWIEQVHPDDRSALVQSWTAAVRDGTTFSTEFRIRSSNGEYRWFDTRAVPLRGEQGEILKWIGSNTDIEERRRAEAEVRDLNANLELRISERTSLLDAARRDLQNILDAMPSMVGYWDRELRNRFANHAYQTWFGLDPASIPGRHMSEVIGPKLYALNRPYLDGVLRGEPQVFEREIAGPDGQTRHSLSKYLPDVVDGQVRGFYVLVHDITEVHRAQAQAEAASAAKSTFLANMSHEIRTPMNAVLGLLQLLQRTSMDAIQQDYVGKASIAGNTLLAILNDILDFSKIEAGKLSLDEHPFSLEALLRELAVLLAASRGGKPIELVFDLDPAVPEDLVGDSLRLMQILINLGGNAIKFTEAGEVVLGLRCGRLTPTHVELAFTVRDTGIGMSPAQCQRVFEGFVQAEAATTRRYGGTGLGLAISQRLALLMGGELWVQSVEGQGSSFHFSVMVERSRVELPVSSPAPRLQGLRLLLVAGCATARRAMAAALADNGWQVQACGDVREALALLGAAGYDAALVDWPVADEAAARQLLAVPGLPVVALTADLSPVARPGGGRPLPSCPKPMTAAMLREALARACLGADAAPDLAEPSAPRLAGLRLLVVEDNPANQLVARGLLMAEGAQVSVASGGAEGVAAVRGASPPYDLVLMDLQMPDVDGYTATRQIRALPGGRSLPIVAMTANAMPADREACLRAGMNEHVAKPFELGQLVATILRCCGRRGLSLPPPRSAPASLPQLLNAVAAQSRLGDSEEIFRDVAECFLRDVPAMAASLLAAGPEPDLATRRRLVHTLKGLAGTIGAERLQVAAREAECELGQQGLAAVQGPAFANLSTVLELSMAGLRALLGAPAAAEGATADAAVNPGELERLETLLRQCSADAFASFADLRRRCGGSDPQGFRALGEAIESLDFERALVACAALREHEHVLALAPR